MQVCNLEKMTVRDLNSKLQDQKLKTNHVKWEIQNPKGSHALAVGLNAEIEVKVKGSTGYYLGGMNQKAKIIIEGSVGPGVAENMMSGSVLVEGDASQYAGATGHGGLLVIKGNASSRCVNMSTLWTKRFKSSRYRNAHKCMASQKKREKV